MSVAGEHKTQSRLQVIPEGRGDRHEDELQVPRDEEWRGDRGEERSPSARYNAKLGAPGRGSVGYVVSLVWV